MPRPSPTHQLYGALQSAYDHFNATLFGGELPRCIITAQRESNVMGHFLPARWVNKSGRKAHEIAINPGYLPSHNLIEVFQTLVHEQCHLWQQEYGSPSRNGYHNREWAEKMCAVGLVPSNTGAPGGKKTGQQMSDYPEPGGRFLAECLQMAEEFNIPWVDRFAAGRDSSHVRITDELASSSPVEIEQELNLTTRLAEIVPDVVHEPFDAPARVAKRKVSYACGSCGIKVWGKPDLNVCCGECGTTLR